MSDWRTTWASWPENPQGIEYVTPNPQVWLLLSHSDQWRTVIAGVYSTQERAEAAHQRYPQDTFTDSRLELLPIPVTVDIDMWTVPRGDRPADQISGLRRHRHAPWQMP